MIIKFKSGHIVHVTDHKDVDKAEIIEKAHFLVNDIKIKDDPKQEHKVLAQKKLISQMSETELLKELKKFVDLYKKNPTLEIGRYTNQLRAEYNRRHPEKKAGIAVKQEQNKEKSEDKESMELLKFILSRSINGIIAKGLEPDAEDIEKAKKLAKQLGVGIKNENGKYVIIKKNLEPVPEGYFDEKLNGYSVEQAQKDYKFSQQITSKINSAVLVETIDHLYERLRDILMNVYADVRKFINEDGARPIYDFSDHENSVSIDKIRNFVTAIYTGIYALKSMMVRYNALFGTDNDAQFEDRLKELLTLQNKIFYFIDGNKIQVTLGE